MSLILTCFLFLIKQLSKFSSIDFTWNVIVAFGSKLYFENTFSTNSQISSLDNSLMMISFALFKSQ